MLHLLASSLGALVTGVVAGVVFAAQPADQPLDPTDLRVLGVLAPFIGFLFWQLYRESKKRDEAEQIIRDTLAKINDTYQPTVQRFMDYIESEERMDRTRRRRQGP